MAVKADVAREKDIKYANKVATEKAKAQADAQKKFNALPKEEQERILYNQYGKEHGTISEYKPDSTLGHALNIATAPFSALKAKMQTGHVPDNLVKGLIQNPDQINPYDAAYLGTLGYAVAPYISSGASVVGAAAAPYATMIGNSLATDAVIGGNTITGLNLGNAINAGFATHGAMKVGPDAAKWLDKPSWDNAYAPIMDTVEMLPAIGPVSKTIGEGLNASGEFVGKGFEYAANQVPKVANFAKDVVGDIGTIGKQYSQLQKIKNSTTAPDALVNKVGGVDYFKSYYNSRIPTLQDQNDLYQLLHGVSNHYKDALADLAGEDFASRISNQWFVDLDATPLGRKIDDIVNNVTTATPQEIQQLGKELIETIPEGKSFIKDAKTELTKLQKQLLFDKNKDFKTLKDFAKSIGAKSPEVAPLEYTPKEKETITAIRELGKYKTIARTQKGKLLADPKAMVNINKEILKLDDDVVQKLLGVTKSELLDSYKNIVPDLKKTQVDITTNPMAAADLSTVDRTDLVSNTNNTPTLAEKQLQGPVNDNRPKSIINRISNSYAKNFGPVNYENPTNAPQGLIGMAKTDYTYPVLKNPDGSLMIDANGKYVFGDELVAEGRTIQQLKGALDKVTAAPKGTNFIGSSSLSTDSYPLTLDSGIMMSNKGLVSVGVENGTMTLNDMGYTNTSPRLAIKDINSKLEELEKISGKKLPRAKYEFSHGHHTYKVPKVYFTRLKTGGTINKEDESSLVKLDQLTNFTNYNTKQPGGWLDQY